MEVILEMEIKFMTCLIPPPFTDSLASLGIGS